MLDSVAVDVSTSVVCATCVGVTLWRRNIFPYPLEAVLVFSCMSEVRPQSSVSVYFLPVCCGCSAVKLTSTRLYLLHSSSNLLTVLSLHTLHPVQSVCPHLYLPSTLWAPVVLCSPSITQPMFPVCWSRE